jgi:hypothetical protein
MGHACAVQRAQFDEQVEGRRRAEYDHRYFAYDWMIPTTK